MTSVDLETATGARSGSGPLSRVTTWQRVRRLDRAGSIAFTMPATDARGSAMTLRQYARGFGIIAGLRAELGLGIIDTIETDTGAQVLTAAGDDLLRELAMRGVSFLELKDAGEVPISVDTALDRILAACNSQADPDWTLDRTTYASTGTTTSGSATIAGVTNIQNWQNREGAPIYGPGIPAGATVATVGTSSLVISAAATATATGVPLSRAQVFYVCAGESVLQALIKVANLSGGHFRLGTGRQIVWLSSVRPPSGIRAVIGADSVAAATNPEICLITSLTYVQDSSDTISHVNVWGSGTGSTRLAMTGSTRAPPPGYTYNATQNVLRRDAAETDYGYSIRHQSFSDIGPTVETSDPGYATALLNAQNMLFDAGLEYLRTHSYPVESYRLGITKLDQEVLPGQTIRVIYAGWVDNYTWVAIDADLLVLEATTEVTDAGVQTPELIVSTVDRWPDDDMLLLARLLRDVQQARAHPQ